MLLVSDYCLPDYVPYRLGLADHQLRVFPPGTRPAALTAFGLSILGHRLEQDAPIAIVAADRLITDRGTTPSAIEATPRYRERLEQLFTAAEDQSRYGLPRRAVVTLAVPHQDGALTNALLRLSGSRTALNSETKLRQVVRIRPAGAPSSVAIAQHLSTLELSK